MDDCCSVEGFIPCPYGPSSLTFSTNLVTTHVADMSSSADEDASAFMVFSTRPTLRQPVIFDTGASLAITLDEADFDGPLTLPKGELRLGGMANGLKFEGMGPAT